MRLELPHIWKKVHDEMVYEEKNLCKKSTNIILVSSQRYQDSSHHLQIPKVSKIVKALNNCGQRFTTP